MTNNDGIPASVSEVDEILDLDDSPIEIFQLEVGMQTIKPKTPMSVAVQFNQESGQYDLDGPFGIMLGAETRPEIETQLFLELAMLWREYVEIPDDMLTSAACRLRDELIASFEVSLMPLTPHLTNQAAFCPLWDVLRNKS